MITPAYLAGLVDGEGCLFVGYEIARTKHRALRINPFLAISLKNGKDTLRLFQAIKDEYGGNLRIGKERARIKEAVTWACENRKALHRILTEIKPFVVLKRRQVELMLEVLSIMDRARPPKPRSVEDILEIAHLGDEIHSLSCAKKKEERKWNSNYIKELIERNPIYRADYHDIRFNVGKLYGFKKGHIPWNAGTMKFVRLTCDACGKEFMRPLRVSRHREKLGSTHKFCSLTCYKEFRKIKRNGFKKENLVERLLKLPKGGENV